MVAKVSEEQSLSCGSSEENPKESCSNRRLLRDTTGEAREPSGQEAWSHVADQLAGLVGIDSDHDRQS